MPWSKANQVLGVWPTSTSLMVMARTPKRLVNLSLIKVGGEIETDRLLYNVPVETGASPKRAYRSDNGKSLSSAIGSPSVIGGCVCQSAGAETSHDSWPR